uniref:Phospholipase A2-like central domain-containing protein n=1 Tax=Amphiprion ocellaris TaxID=80972 RepID=A0AAQ5ZLD4_AMPOC
MTRPAALLLMLTSSFLSCTAAATAVSIFCTWTKVSPDEQEVHYIFLRQAAASLRLYHSSWSGQRALRSCAWSDDAAVIHSYLALCRERTQEFSDHPNDNFDLDSMFVGEEEQCVSLASPGVGEQAGRRPVRSVGGPDRGERSEVRIHQRVKRGFIVPGTLWCGSGNKAPSYADLGVFSDTDSCCREHDQCKHTILSFHSQFGVFNTNIFTMSHCDCDNKFRSCLKEANDSIADVIQSSCDIYKDLDECKEKILPWQKKYGLYNPELRTLYHCNCTTRFFQTLTKQRQVTEVQALLLGHVSQSCFQPRDCTAGSTSVYECRCIHMTWI